MKSKMKNTFSEIRKEYLLPLLLEFVILAALIMVFYQFIGRGPLVQEIRLVGDEESSPTVGRLIYGIISFVGFAVCTKLASNAAKADHDRSSFWFGFAAGVMLWQSVGEISWHYSVAGINFVPLENVTSLPMALMFLLLLVYGKRHHSFDWGVWCMLLSFACNWFGHYITIGIYPFVSNFFTERAWNLGISYVTGILFLIYSVLFLLFRAKTTKGRMLASLMSYISIAVIYFGIAEG